MILEGMNYLVSKDITQLSISCDTIHISIQGEIKLGEIIFESKMKRLNRSIKKIKSEAELESVNTTQICDLSNLMLNFGKTVLNMLFSNPNAYKLVIKLIHPTRCDFLLNNILQEDLRDFLRNIIVNPSTCTITDLLQHKFLKQRKDFNDEKLKIGIELSNFIELNKLNKTPADINNSAIPYSIVEEDSRFTNDYQIEHPTEHRKRPNSKKKASKNSGAQGDKIPKSLTKANPFLNIDSLSKKKTPKDKKKNKHKGNTETSCHTLGDLHLITAPILASGNTNSEQEYKYKEDKSGNDNRLEETKTQIAERNQTNTDVLDVTKQRKSKNIKKMKSVKMKFENMLADSRILFDLLQLNDNSINQKVLEKYNLSSIPLIMDIQYHGSKYEVKFDYNLTKDSEKGVAEELCKALNLPDKCIK